MSSIETVLPCEGEKEKLAHDAGGVGRNRHLINREAVRDFALHCAATGRGGRFTRVSSQFLDEIEALVRSSIVSRVHRAPGIGKTLALLVMIGLAAGCVTGQRIQTGPARAAIAAEAVQLAAAAPAGAVEVGLVSAASEGHNQEAMDIAVRELKKQSARMGGNYLVILSTDMQSGRGNSAVGIYSAGVIFTPASASHKTVVSGKAYYVGGAQ